MIKIKLKQKKNLNLRGVFLRTDRQTEHLVSNPRFLDVWLVLSWLGKS